MKKWLAAHLICPECLDNEVRLDLEIEKEKNGDVSAGGLACPACKRSYAIRDGVAVILPDKAMPAVSGTSGYNSRGMLSSYLWSHYCDIFGDPRATDAYRVWSSFFTQPGEVALDIGCAVGRLSFEMSNMHSRVIGIDTSVSFIQRARELMLEKRLAFDLIMEGFVTEKRECDFGERWQYDRVEFIVADALALPFPKNMFSTVTSINILEKVPHPLKHLQDVNRVLQKHRSLFVFSDPFSWDETVSDPENWLGGRINGNQSYRGMDNVIRYLWGKGNVFDPPMEIQEKGDVTWKIRKTENLWEHINSQFVVGMRR